MLLIIEVIDPFISQFLVEKAMDVDNWTYKARNSVLFNDMDEAPLTFEEYVHRSKQNEKIVNKEATRFKIEQKQPNQVN